MPKASDKTKGAQKRKRTPNTSNTNTESEESESKPVSKKKVKRNNNILEGIEMSKELSEKIKQRRTRRSKYTKNTEPQLCGNGKPMPSLAELEAMYTDSEEDENPENPTQKLKQTVRKPEINDKSLKSPTVLKEIASQVMDLISKKIEGIEDTPPPQVVPPKKRKKPDQPYIVGCKDREQVPWAPKTNFLVGDEKYGVEDGNNSDDDCFPKKRKKRGKKINLSKSIFNAKSDEIAEKLTNEAESVERGSSPDSNDTVSYDLPSNSPGPFSPLPSTSRDSETILKNDKLFNDSLIPECLPNESRSDLEIIEIPYEEVVIDDSLNNTSINNNISYNDTQDDCYIIETKDVKVTNSVSTVKAKSPKDEIYSSIDLTQLTDNEVYEIGNDDIESVIAENQMILKKHKKKNSIDSVTAVDSSLRTQSEVEVLNSVNVSSNDNTSSLNNTNTNDINDLANPSVSAEPAIQVDNQYTTALNSAQNTGGNEIEVVVTDFFNQQSDNNSVSSRNTRSINLTNGQDTMTRRLFSLLSSIESIYLDIFFRGRRVTRTSRNNDDVVVVDDDISPSNNQTSQVPSVPVAPSNNENLVCLTPNSPVNTSPRRKNSNKNKKSTDSSISNKLTSPQKDSQPRSGRSLGDCPICMDSLNNKAVASTLCGHVFCMGCIITVFRSNGKRCPTCRKVLKGPGFHQLFL